VAPLAAEAVRSITAAWPPIGSGPASHRLRADSRRPASRGAGCL